MSTATDAGDVAHSPGTGCSRWPHRHGKETSTQTDAKTQGHVPRLSKVNLYTLLSLWMELFPTSSPQEQCNIKQTRASGLVVVQERVVMGLHCSSAELHAGQVAVVRHGSRLKGCHLYFSRKPCSTCLKMIVNDLSHTPILDVTPDHDFSSTKRFLAGVNRISYWPGDPELSLLASSDSCVDAELDAQAAERLRSNCRPQVCVLLQPLGSRMQQFVEEKCSTGDFLTRMARDQPELDISEMFTRQRRGNLRRLCELFLVEEERHAQLLFQLGLESLSMEPCLSHLRQNMRDLVGLLASVISVLPQEQPHYGFYSSASRPPVRPSQEVIRHCIIQAQLLAFRTEDPKVGVGAVIWAEGKSEHSDGTGRLYLVGCGYNAYPAGSVYAEFPQMDDKQQDRQSRKYRYIIHAEQNALIFRTAEVREEENSMMFVTKCPCDECVPLIRGAGIKAIYTTDLDSGKDKRDISYLKFDKLQGVQKYTWQKEGSVPTINSFPNGSLGKHSLESPSDPQLSKRTCH